MALATWNLQRFEESIEKSLDFVRRTLDGYKNPISIGRCSHNYEDKFDMVHSLTDSTIAAHLTILSNLGMDMKKLAMLQNWSKTGHVTLRFKSTETSRFLGEKTKKYGDDNKLIVESGYKFFSSHKIRTVTEYMWSFGVEYELIAFTGADEATAVSLQGRRSSYEVGILTSGPFRPEAVIRPVIDVDITWLLHSLVNGNEGDSKGDFEAVPDLRPHFKINRTAKSCRTPRRNAETEEAINFLHNFAEWGADVSKYFLIDVFPLQLHYQTTQRRADVDISSINTNGLFVPVLPVLMIGRDLHSTSDRPVTARSRSGSHSTEESENTDSRVTVSICNPSYDIPQPTVMSTDDCNEVLRYHQATLQDKYAALDMTFSSTAMSLTEATSLITPAEAKLLVNLMNAAEISQQYVDAMEYLEELLYKQLVAAIGKEVQPGDFEAYMRYHNNKMFQSKCRPRPFCHAIRRSAEHTPEGMLSLEMCSHENGKAEAVYTLSREISARQSAEEAAGDSTVRNLHHECDTSAHLRVPLNSSVEIVAVGKTYVHAFLLHQFEQGAKESGKSGDHDGAAAPLGYYEANAAGVLTRPSYDNSHTHTMRRYCGRMVHQAGYHQSCGGHCDGRCGPTNGCQCRECFDLDEYESGVSGGNGRWFVTCPSGHPLVICIRKQTWVCDAPNCSDGTSLRNHKPTDPYIPRFRCSGGCDFDYCGPCYHQKAAVAGVGSPGVSSLRCPQNHDLALSSDSRPWICDASSERPTACLSCGSSSDPALYGQVGRWRCVAGCDFDYCGHCAAAKIGSKVRHQISTPLPLPVSTSPVNSLVLKAEARQFSGYIVMLGRISSATSFDPKYAMIVQNKDDITIPLDLETIPSAKEFKDAISSLSPEQQRFARAYRGLQLESTLFAVLVIQIKPQLEKVLNLPPDSLTKEIELQQDLMKLFIDYQVPSDLLSFEGGDMSYAGKVSTVRSNVEAIQQLIDDTKQQILDEANQEMHLLQERNRQLTENQRNLMPACIAPKSGGTRGAGPRPTPPGCVGSRARKLPRKVTGDKAPRNLSSTCSANIMTASTSAAPAAVPPSRSTDAAENTICEGTSPSMDHAIMPSKGSPSATVDITLIPSMLDEKLLELDHTGAVRPTIITPKTTWKRVFQKGLLSVPETASLGSDKLLESKTAAYGLLDALTKAGGITVEHADLHVVIAASHCFDKSLIDTIVQDSVNPIEKVVNSTLIIAQTIHQKAIEDMIQGSQVNVVRNISGEIMLTTCEGEE